MINEEPHQGLKPNCKPGETRALRKDYWAGDAWPSSVRGLNCSLKWGNERNPRRVLQVSHETAAASTFKFFLKVAIENSCEFGVDNLHLIHFKFSLIKF